MVHVATLLSACLALSCAHAAATSSAAAPPALGGRTGFLHPDGDNATGLFYWIFEATEVAPADAPLVLWLQGGPGASSLLGQFYELGPHRLAEGGAAGVAPTANAAAWNQRANLVFIDQPFGTGFSYANDAARLVTSMPQMAAALRLALAGLAIAEPDLAGLTAGTGSGAGRPLWLTGESYAGKYIPYLATEVMARGGVLAAALRRGGLAIGDGWVDPARIVASYPDFAYAHGLVGGAQRDAMDANVTLFEAAVSAGNWGAATDIEHGVEAYMESASGANAYDVRHLGPYDFDALAGYLARPDVKAALGVGGRPWTLGSPAVAAALHDDVAKPASQLIAPLLDEHGLRVLLYNGENDFDCNIVGTLSWLAAMRWSGQAAFASAPRTQWAPPGAESGGVAGYATSVGNLTQLTLVGCGHMVPMNVPRTAVAMLNQLLAGTPF